MSEETIIRILSSSPAAVAILAAAWLAKRALFPFVESLFSRYEKQLDLNRAAARERTDTGQRLAGELAKLTDALQNRNGSVFKCLALLLCVAALLAGCAGGDPLVKRMLDRNRQVWEEDRRPDLDQDLVRSRLAEFSAQARYLESR